MVTGALDEYEAFARRGVEAWRAAGQYSWLAHLYVGYALFWQGWWDEAIESFETSVQENTWDAWNGWSWGALLMAKASAGHADVPRLWSDQRAGLATHGEPALAGRRILAAVGVDALVLVGERGEAARLYLLIADIVSDGLVVGGAAGNLIENTAGIAAAAGEQWEVAEEHFETALRQAREMPDTIAEPEVRRCYARMLLDRDAAGDKDKARTLLGEAIEMYRTIGMPKHLEMAEGMLERL